MNKHFKIVRTKKLVCLYNYQYGINTKRYLLKPDNKHNNGGRPSGIDLERYYNFDNLLKYLEIKKGTQHKAKSNIINLVNANVEPYSKFITLTFKDNVGCIDYANNEFIRFIDRLNYHFFKTKKRQLKYTAVVELQKRGAIHYHIIIYNLPFIHNKQLRKIWGNGFVRINKIDNVGNVGFYLTKYMTKTFNDFSLMGRKTYFNSRNLTKPDVRYLDNNQLGVELKGLTYTGQKEFNSKFYGKTVVFYYEV